MPSVVVTQPQIVAEAVPSDLVTRGAGGGVAVFVPEVVPRMCTLEHYEKQKISTFRIENPITAYASPDSTFAVTQRLIDGARKTILIGIYDFTADHVKQLVLKAMRRGVKVELMLDIDGKTEQSLFRELERFGAECTPAPSCASKKRHVFRSSHEKVIVIDDEWSLVQSGNYSDNSIPLNTKDGGDPKNFTTGNRDTGLAVKDRKLAAFFRRILESDISLELEGPQAAARVEEALADTFLVEAAPRHIPAKLFKSKEFKLTNPLTVTPVMSPDNYMKVVPDLLAAARKSILIEQQYIRGKQSHIQTLLQAIATARSHNTRLDVRIVLGKVFSKQDLATEKKNLDLLKTQFKLAVGKNIRFINTDRFVHCHNKLIVIDGQGVLVSSQNWSNAAVAENREAGLFLQHKGIAGYFANIFESDWDTAVEDPTGKAPDAVGPEALRGGGFIRVMAGDYV